MTTKDIVKQAKKRGLCKEWFADFLKDNSIKHLCEKYFEGSDWAMEHDFPNLAILQEFKGQTEQYGLFTDFEGSTDLQKSAFFGKSEVEIVAKDYDVRDIYIRHDSTAIIEAKGNSKVFVNVLDNAKLTVKCYDDAHVSVYAYGDLGNITCEGGNIKVLKTDFN